MQYPFKEKHKIDSGFGVTRSYGYHSGADINGIKGGNTDCGYKLYPIVKGKITHSSISSVGYGPIVVYKIEGPWGVRWIRYCHCDQILVKSGLVKPETPIALLGTRGSSTACHLHWDVIKKPMRNWRTYARTKAVLHEHFEDPLAFIEKWRGKINTTQMPKNLNWLVTMYNELEIDLTKSEGEVRPRVQDIFDNSKKYEQLSRKVEKISGKLAEAVGELEQTKVWFLEAREGREELKKEVKELKEDKATRDTQITELSEKVKILEDNANPEKNMLIPTEEYKKLTARRTLDRFSDLELLLAILKRRLGFIGRVLGLPKKFVDRIRFEVSDKNKK